MNTLIIKGIALFLICGAINANASLSESEKVLSGFQRVPNVESLPDEIELPAVWIEALRELSKRSLETTAAGIEYGVCLNAVAKGIGGDRRQHMEAYRLLLKEKANMSSNEFANKERELRRLIASDKDGRDEGVIWNAGKIQTGEDSEITYKHGETVCDGEIVSDAHTHPEVDTEVAFSFQDLAYFIGNGRTSHLVINSSSATCLFLRTSAVGSISDNFIWDISTEVIPYVWAGRYSQRLAWYAQTIGVGLYCGDLRAKMKKITPDKTPPLKVPPGFYILSAKAYLSSLERLENNPVGVASHFQPEVDDVFLTYLMEILPNKPHYTRMHKSDFRKTSTPEEIFRYALSFYSKANINPLRNITNIQCSTGLCISADDLWKGKPTRFFASFSYTTQDSYWVEGNQTAGFYKISEDSSNKIRYEGPCKFFDKQCLAEGNGILKTSDFEYHGQFRAGKMEGDGELRKPLQNEIHRVKMVNGEIKEIKRVQ